jgi:hypothetical protein
MKAITVEDLQEWFESEEIAAGHRYDVPSAEDLYYDGWAQQDQQREAEYVASKTAQQRLDYMVHNGELAHCPRCGTRYAEVDWYEFPDMRGVTSVMSYECCGHTDSSNSAIEYNEQGQMIDIN